MPLSIVRAAASSLGSTTPCLSLASVLIALDTADGSDRPYEFSARTRKTYDVAGFSSGIWKEKIAVKYVYSRSPREISHEDDDDKCPADDDVEHYKFLITHTGIHSIRYRRLISLKEECRSTRAPPVVAYTSRNELLPFITHIADE